MFDDERGGVIMWKKGTVLEIWEVSIISGTGAPICTAVVLARCSDG
jgi:hypothetical protein